MARTTALAAAPAQRGVTSVVRALFSQPASTFGAIVVILFLLVALFGPLIAPYGLNEQIPEDARQPPSAQHWFGADNLGRDVFSRLMIGARDILTLAGLGTLLSVITGTTAGLLSGYLGGWFDEIIMRFFDSLLAIPALLLALLLVGAIGSSRNSVLLVLLVVYTPIVARVVRSVTLSVKSLGYVDAARLQGESLPAILWREILPSVVPALSVEAALRFSYAIFLVASLGFLGVGVQPPRPDWGLMVKEARTNVYQTPWALWFPAGAIALLVIGVNLTADGLKRAWERAS
jgi:peptide/nickel transport system permease protein